MLRDPTDSPELDALKGAYVQLLFLPVGSRARIETDDMRARLRDMIAEHMGKDPEYVQGLMEAKAETTKFLVDILTAKGRPR